MLLRGWQRQQHACPLHWNLRHCAHKIRRYRYGGLRKCFMHHPEAIINLFRGIFELAEQCALHLFENLPAPKRPEESRIFGTTEQCVTKRHRHQDASIQHRRIFIIERQYQSNGTLSYVPCSNSVRARSSRVLRRAESRRPLKAKTSRA